ncbi:MAG: UbiA family prenyltransferase [Candidatus Thermoplasmatota archaeon]
MKNSVKAYIDLTRLQFGFAWPILFCSGFFLGCAQYRCFDWVTLLKAVIIGLCGFEAGLVLNDYVDRHLDQKDIDPTLTRYWRVFKKRPLGEEFLHPNQALGLFFILVALTLLVIATLPHPHSLYLVLITAYCYSVEYFYQIHKRKQKYPIAQLIGRTDFALFPVAGYLMVGHPDITALLYFLFFYPFALAHLAVNDMVDELNDQARRMQSITILYGFTGSMIWITFFTIIHYAMAAIFVLRQGIIASIGFAIGFIVLGIANVGIIRRKTRQAALKALPFFHSTMLIYSVSLILDKVY